MALFTDQAAVAGIPEAILSRPPTLDAMNDSTRGEPLTTPKQVHEALQRQKTMSRLPLGDALVQERAITVAQRDAAIAAQKAGRRQALGEILVEMGVVKRAIVQRTLIEQLGFPQVALDRFRFDDDALGAIPPLLAHELQAVPLCRSAGRIAIAMENPLAREALQELEFYTGVKVDPVIAGADEIADALERHFGRPLPAVPPRKEGVEAADRSDDAIATLVNGIVHDAIKEGASDIHIEAQAGGLASRVRLRIEGELRERAGVPEALRAAVVARLKAMAELDATERRRPQEGRVRFAGPDATPIEIDVVTLPTARGFPVEDLVMRVASAPKFVPADALGMDPRSLATLRAMLRKSSGLIVVTGPRGSGRTTTLHSLLAEVNSSQRKVCTVEDPVEIHQEGLCQVPANPRLGLDFPEVLRSCLRAEPDVILVGDTREPQTARAAMSASLSGRLVLTSMNVGSAVESVARLLRFGLERFALSDTLLAVVGQRLVRRLCPHCREAYTPSEAEIASLALEHCRDKRREPAAVAREWGARLGCDSGGVLYRARGCEHCHGSGYKGRAAVTELLVVTPRLKSLIGDGADASALREAAMAEEMRSLEQDGIEKVLQGVTDLKQVLSVCS